MSAEDLNKPVPQIRPGMGKRVWLTPDERTGARKIRDALERVRNGDSWAWAEFIPNRPKALKFGTWARDGWNEIDLLAKDAGGLNRMRMIVRVVKGENRVSAETNALTAGCPMREFFGTLDGTEPTTTRRNRRRRPSHPFRRATEFDR